MSKKDRRSHDQKRKAKLTERARRRGKPEQSLAYSGPKYQQPEWTPLVFATELAIYETIRLSERHLTNEQVRTVVTELIELLRRGEPALLAEDAPEMTYTPGSEVDYLSWNIRRNWGKFIAKHGPVAKEDLIGILRTLLHSIEARAAHTGPSRGYVAFLEEFIGKMPYKGI